MTATEARASLDRAQDLLERVTADNASLADLIGWLAMASDRADELDDYIRGQGIADTEAVLADDPEAVTPPVANEDAAWEAIADHHDLQLRLLRVVTSALTRGLDADPDDSATDV